MIDTLLQPYRFLLVLAVIGGVVLHWRRRKEPRKAPWLVTVPVFALAFLCWPPMHYLLLSSLESRHPTWVDPPRDWDAVVVLAGQVLPRDAHRPVPELGAETIARCRMGAWLAKAGPGRPVVVAGGRPNSPSSGPPPAELMRDFLVELGIPPEVIRVEPESRDTRENAENVARIADRAGWFRIALVTDALHLRRASACFRRQGFEVIPVPCNWRTPDLRWSFKDFLPDPSAAASGRLAIHEWFGLAYYRFRGWI